LISDNLSGLTGPEILAPISPGIYHCRPFANLAQPNIRYFSYCLDRSAEKYPVKSNKFAPYGHIGPVLTHPKVECPSLNILFL